MKGEILSFDGIFCESRNKTALTTNLLFTRALLAHQINFIANFHVLGLFIPKKRV
jgi:hypothetical protein